MKVMFAVPAYDGKLTVPCVASLLSVRQVLNDAGIQNDVSFLSGSCYISAARNKMVADFMESGFTDLFFVDSDVGFPADAALRVLLRPELVVGGVYPMKNENNEFPVVVKTTPEGTPIGCDGLIEATGLPAGFLRIKREVFERLAHHYPGLAYKENSKTVYGFFDCAIMDDGRWWGDDLAFCERWRRIGGEMWVLPDIDFRHVGNKTWTGNYHQFLLNQPKE